MQIKQFLLIILIAFFSFPAIQASGQCLIDAEYEVSFEHNKGSIQVVFEHSATGVVIELVDLLKSEEGVIQAKKLGTVRPSHESDLFSNLRKSIYMLLLTSNECSDPKYDLQVVEVGFEDHDE